jgi:hypothetical protein
MIPQQEPIISGGTENMYSWIINMVISTFRRKTDMRTHELVKSTFLGARNHMENLEIQIFTADKSWDHKQTLALRDTPGNYGWQKL